DIITAQTWDDSSRLIAQTDDNGNATRYAYDGLDRLIVTLMGEGTLRQVGSNAVWSLGNARPDLSSFGSGYDVHGNRLSSLDANGSRVDSSYDLNNRLMTVSVTLAAGVLGTTNESYQYDGLSRLVRAQDDDSTVTCSYDSLSRIISETQML